MARPMTGQMAPHPQGPRLASDAAFDWYVGIDCGGAGSGTTHQVAVLDACGERVGERAVGHTAGEMEAFATMLHEVAGPSLARVAVGVESPHGGPVAMLLEQGAAVFTINPKQLERFRERQSVAGAKDDRRDAYAAASALRTDRACFHRLVPDDARLLAIRELSRLAAELRTDMGRLSNRLREQLYRILPQLLTLVPAADEPWLWALLVAATTPAAVTRLREGTVQRVLRAHRIRRLSAADVVAVLRQPAVPVVPGTVPAVSAHIALLLPQLLVASQQERRCTAQLEAALQALMAEAPDPPGPAGGTPNAPSDVLATPGAVPDAVPNLATTVRVVRSLPGVGRGVAGTLLAEASGALLAHDYEALRTRGGTAPVTKRTGKRRPEVVMRYACNGRLREALYHWARTSTRVDAAARTYYAALRARGHSHARALRSVADRWLRILVAMLASGTTYDATRFAAAVPLTP